MKPDTDKSSNLLKKIDVFMGYKNMLFIHSPLRLMSALLLCALVVQTFVIILLESREPIGWKETLIVSTVLTAIFFVILFYRLFKPLVVLINDYRSKEMELENYQAHLEREIQERKCSEAALFETRAILQTAFDQSPAGIVIANAPDGVLRYVNNAGLFIGGDDRETLVGNVGIDKYVSTWKILDLEGNLLKNEDVPLTRAILYGETCSREIVVRKTDDDYRFVIVNAAPIRNDSEEIVAGVAVCLDITDRKRVEEALKVYQNYLEQMVQERSRDLEDTTNRLQRENAEHIKSKAALLESEERFRQFFEQSEDAIVLIAPQDNSIIDVNPKAERIFQKSRAELVSGGLTDLCDEDGYKYLKSTLELITSDNVPGRIERLVCAINPEAVRIISFRGKLINLQGDTVVYSTFRDITNRVRLEQQALEIQARLIQANRMTSLGTMVSSVAHEINNPNNFLLMNVEIIKRAWDDVAPVIEEHYQSKGDFAVAQSTWSEARSFLPEAVEGIRQGALRISAIVGNLKDYGRDERFNQESVANVNEVVQLSVSILSQLISSSTRRFTLKLAEGLPLVRGSARQLEQVVINLVQNALLALPDVKHGVTVGTGLDPDSGQVLIRVSDEGIGIAPEIAARVMEPFFTTRLERGGTGLGLAISATIVKEHGGTIEFISEPGMGTTFSVRLCPAASSEKNMLNREENHVHK